MDGSYILDAYKQQIRSLYSLSGYSESRTGFTTQLTDAEGLNNSILSSDKVPATAFDPNCISRM